MLDVKPLPADVWHYIHAGAEKVDADDEEGGEADWEEGHLAPQSQVTLTLASSAS